MFSAKLLISVAKQQFRRVFSVIKAPDTPRGNQTGLPSRPKAGRPGRRQRSGPSVRESWAQAPGAVIGTGLSQGGPPAAWNIRVAFNLKVRIPGLGPGRPSEC